MERQDDRRNFDHRLALGRLISLMNILFIENHARFARIASTQFLSAHQVTIVASLQDARNALTNTRFEAVLLDYDLDDGKGTELFETLRELKPQPLIVATSSHHAGNTLLLDAGANALCSKMEFQKIETILLNLLQHKEKRQNS